jgi:integrase
MMNSKFSLWSEKKQQRLQEDLKGMWADDVWVFLRRQEKRYLRFPLTSLSLKREVKYAVWRLFEDGQRIWGTDQSRLCADLKILAHWLNMVAPKAQSLLQKTLEAWEESLHAYLVEHGQFKQLRRKHLLATQEYAEYALEDSRIRLFRQLYEILVDVYDDRPEMERDLWDMRKLGLSLNPTIAQYYLNFALIAQLWLRHLAKEFMKYRIAIYTPADCQAKMNALRAFSQFLSQSYPDCQPSDIDRPLIVTYIHFLRASQRSAIWKNQLLTNLRLFLETCAHRLQIPNMTKERIIFDDDFVKEPEYLSREIPEEVQVQLREHLDSLPTMILRMVTILWECGLRINELCTLPRDCLICDDKHEWYLRFYQRKSHKEHIIPLVEEKVVGVIQAQQQEMREQRGENCPFLFPNPRSSQQPYRQTTFADILNRWALSTDIRDRNGNLWRFQTHQFRHTMSMKLLDEDVPLEIIRRLLGHTSLRMTERYARKRAAELRKELERVARRRKTVDYQGRAVKGDPQANDPEAQIVRQGVRGQTLPVGGCGRLVVLGACNYANKCLTCPMWLTSTDDLPALKSFYERAIRLRQRASDTGNHVVVQQQEHIIATLAVRIKSLEETSMDGTLCVDDVLAQLYTDLAEAESGLEEARDAGLVLAAKHLERTMTELKARIAALEEAP